MRNMFSNILVLLTVTFSVNTGMLAPQERTPSLSDLNWLLGTWERKTSRGSTFEQWKQVSDQTIEGLGFQIRAGEKAISEFLRLEQFGSDIFYTAKPQENPYPTAFKLTVFELNLAVFENPDHDFPQKMIYKLREDGSLHARIEGPRNGQTAGIDFFFSRTE